MALLARGAIRRLPTPEASPFVLPFPSTLLAVSGQNVALVAAGLLSVLLFPLTSLTLLRGGGEQPEDLLEPAG